jgi:hypothetical protein
VTEPGTRSRRPTAVALSATRVLGTLTAAVAVALTAGCGSSTSSGAASAAPTDVDVHLISVTAAGGLMSRTASPLNTPDQISGFARQFRVPAMEHRIRALIAPLGGNGDIEGAVVAVGCDVPPGAAVTVDDGGAVTISPQKVRNPLQECRVPVTTVAIAVLPSS